MKRNLIALLVLVSVNTLGNGAPDGVSISSRVEFAKPNPQLSRPLGHEPTQAELNQLQRVVGQTPREVLRRIGHPRSVRQLGQGVEIWYYAWGKDGIPVEFRNGSAVSAGEERYSTGFLPRNPVNP